MNSDPKPIKISSIESILKKEIGDNKAIELLADKDANRASAYEIIRIAKQNALKVVKKQKEVNSLELLQKKDNRLGIIISIILHLFLLIAIFFSKGCMELQNPPQFTLEEVITLDFSDAGGGSPGSASPTPPTVEEEAPAEKVITQEESPVAVKSSNSTIKNENTSSKKTETKEAPKPKNDFSSLFGKGSG